MTRLENRAEELRTMAEGVRDPESRQALLKWAEEYDVTLRGLLRARAKAAERRESDSR